MAIQGVQVIYRLVSTIRLFVDYRTSVDSFNVYYSGVEVGPYTFLKNVLNAPSKVSASKGKIIFEFHTDALVGWNNNERNYIKLSEVIGGVEGVLEGPLVILPRLENITPKEYTVIMGLNKDLQKFIPVLVDSTGKLVTT